MPAPRLAQAGDTGPDITPARSTPYTAPPERHFGLP